MGQRDKYLLLGERMEKAFAENDIKRAEELARSVFSIGFAHVGEYPKGGGWLVSDTECPNGVAYRGNREECIAFWEGHQYADYYETLVVCVDSLNPVIVWPERMYGEPLKKHIQGDESEAGN